MEFSRLNFEDFFKEKARKEHHIDSPGQIQTRGFIGTWKEANDHEIYNEFIFGGYRVNFFTWKETLCTVCQLHNESVNVWTHAFGFILGLAAFAYICSTDAGEIVS